MEETSATSAKDQRATSINIEKLLTLTVSGLFEMGKKLDTLQVVFTGSQTSGSAGSEASIKAGPVQKEGVAEGSDSLSSSQVTVGSCGKGLRLMRLG